MTPSEKEVCEMQKKWHWPLLGCGIAVFLAVAACLLWLFVPRQVNLQTQGLMIHSDGTTEVTDVQIVGSWKPVLFDDAKQEFTGTIRVAGLPWLNREDVTENKISFMRDGIMDASTNLLIGADFIRQKNLDLLGNLWIWTNHKMDGFIMIATEHGASTVTRIIVPAKSVEDAIALRDAWNIPESELNFQ
jgi:hypothetical protein